jgi:hypothetical protein
MLLQLLSKYGIEITYILCAILGGIMHWIKKFLNKETDAQLLDWYGRNNVAASIYTFTVFFFAIVGSLAADIINSQTGFWAAMYTGFVTGFAIDSGFNRDMRDVHKDMIENKASMKDYFNKEDQSDSYTRGRTTGGRTSGNRNTYNNDRVNDKVTCDDKVVDREESDDDREPVQNKPLTVEERRAQLRKKLKS